MSIEKGDKPGHPFRGNQHTSGQGEIKTARNAGLSRWKLAQRLSEQLAEELYQGEEKSEKELLAYQMMGSALGDVGTTAKYSVVGSRIVAAISYEARGSDLHVDFLGGLVKGEGSRLLSQVESLADKEGRAVTLMAVSTARAFYESRGYVITDEKDLEMRREPKATAKADADDIGPLAYSKKVVNWRKKGKPAQKFAYDHPETCPCCAQNGAHAVLKAAPKSRVREYVENSASALKTAIGGLLQKWGKRWAKKLTQVLPAAATKRLKAKAKKVDLGLLTKASNKSLEQILDEIEASGFSVALMDEVNPAMAKAFKDGGLVARKMVGLENDAREMLELMDEDARDFAKARAAELVGMKWDEDSEAWVKNPNAKWSITATTRQGLRNLTTEAIEQGWSAQELQERILDSFFFSEQRAEMIARTELAFAHVQGNLKGWKDTGVVAGKRSILADTHPFEDVCDENEAQGVVPLDEPFQDGSMGPPYHPNCVLPDTELSAFGVLKAYKRGFIGEVVSLLCEGDNHLTVTPNHPVLTQRGWVPAGQVKAGDYLFKGVRPDLIVALISPDHHYMPTPAHELFDSLVLSGSVRPVVQLSGTSAFHGDGISDSEVHIVDTNSLLRIDWKSQLKKYLEHLLLPLTKLPGLLISLGSKFFGLDRVLVTNAGQEGVRSYSAAFSKVPLGVKKGLGLKPSPKGKTPPLEIFIDGGRVTVEALSEIYRAFSGEITLVQVLDISVSEYRGHVYNLSTKDGWYFADGIITHNCLCDIVPVLDDEMPQKLDKGDKPGHPFRGNQYTGGVGSTPDFRADNPGGSWLAEEQAYAASQGNNEYGAPKRFGATTGDFTDYVLVPVDQLAVVRGQAGEQYRVRQDDLESLKGYMGEHGKLPPGYQGKKEYAPFVQVDQHGTPWVNEGNHRIMAAKALGWKYLPIQLTYHSGGEAVPGAWHPKNILARDKALRGTPRISKTDLGLLRKGQ